MRSNTIPAKAVMLLVLCLLPLLFISCQQAMSAPTGPELVDVTFKIGSSSLIEGNLGEYRIQFRSIPLFGNRDTPGRHENWTDAKETKPGEFVLAGIETGTWRFYVRVTVPGMQTALKPVIDVATGEVSVMEDYTVIINEEDSDLTGFSQQDLYIRSDYVYDKQSLKIVYESTTTGEIYDIATDELEIVKTGRTTIDYFLHSGQLPCGNYVVTVSIYGMNDVVIMSKEQTVQLRASGTESLVMRLRAEAGTPGGIIIGGGKELEGFLDGPKNGVMGEEILFRFKPFNEYTESNAVWYYWYADAVSDFNANKTNDHRHSTKEAALILKFEAPGQYEVSCTPVGINGEVMKDGVVSVKIRIDEKPPEEISPEGSAGSDSQTDEAPPASNDGSMDGTRDETV